MNNFLQVNRGKLEKYKDIFRVVIKIVAIILCVCGVYYIYINRHVKFQDQNMAYEISRTIGGDNWKPVESEVDITILSKKQAAYYQKELSDLIFSLSKLKEFYFSDLYGNCDITDFDFLKECDNLEILWIGHSDVKDFSFLNGCKNIKEIDLWGSQIKSASDLEILENLETICVYDTPLVQDENEIKTLCDAFPNAKIFISEGRVQNLDKKTD